MPCGSGLAAGCWRDRAGDALDLDHKLGVDGLPVAQSPTVSSGRPIARARAACPPTLAQATGMALLTRRFSSVAALRSTILSPRPAGNTGAGSNRRALLADFVRLNGAVGS